MPKPFKSGRCGGGQMRAADLGDGEFRKREPLRSLALDGAAPKLKPSNLNQHRPSSRLLDQTRPDLSIPCVRAAHLQMDGGRK